MLTKRDLQQIDELVQRSIKTAFQDFYENIFEPYLAKNENEHAQMIREIKVVKKDISGLKGEMSEIKDFVKDHKKRIINLENTVLVKN